jgi:trehalose 6-phosphate synthase complex regulatory subunit
LYPYAREFVQTVSRILGIENVPDWYSFQLKNRISSFSVFPIGIDVLSLRTKRDSPEVQDLVCALRMKYESYQIIIGRDKLAPIKGVRQKLTAFKLFLSKYPEFIGKVILIQVALSTNEQSQLSGQISELVSEINSLYGRLDYTPVVYLQQDISFTHYLALLCIADICIISSLHDGMNLTSFEYVMCQEDRKGSLIISEFVGAYQGFSSALRINPWDYSVY